MSLSHSQGTHAGETGKGEKTLYHFECAMVDLDKYRLQ